MGLRELIEAKQRRTTTWPLLVGNPSAAAAEVAAAQRAVSLHEETLSRKRATGKKPTAAERKRGEQLQAELQAAAERMTGTVVKVELQSLPEHEWEAIFGDLEADDDGDLDLGPIHAALLAASCTDPDLQDSDWWAEQLQQPTWTDGDKATLSRVLLELNVFAPRFDALGKG